MWIVLCSVLNMDAALLLALELAQEKPWDSFLSKLVPERTLPENAHAPEETCSWILVQPCVQGRNVIIRSDECLRSGD